MRSPGDEISQQKFIGPFGWQRRLCRGQSDLNKCSACASAFLKCVFQSPRRAVSPMSWQLRSCARRDAPLDGNGRARPHHYHHAQSCPLPCHRVKALACSRFAARRPARAFAAASASHQPRNRSGLRRGAAGTGTSHLATGHAASPPWPTPQRCNVRTWRFPYPLHSGRSLLRAMALMITAHNLIRLPQGAQLTAYRQRASNGSIPAKLAITNSPSPGLNHSPRPWPNF